MSNLKDFIGGGFTDKQCQETHDGVVDLLLNAYSIELPIGAIIPFKGDDADIPNSFDKYNPSGGISLLKSNSDNSTYLYATSEAGAHTHSTSGTGFNGSQHYWSKSTNRSAGGHVHLLDIAKLEGLPVGKKIKLIKSNSVITELPVNCGVFSDNLDILMKGSIDLQNFNDSFIFVSDETTDILGDDYNSTGKTTDTYNLNHAPIVNISGAHNHNSRSQEGNNYTTGADSCSTEGAHTHTNPLVDADIELHNVYIAVYIAHKLTKISNDIYVLWDLASPVPSGWRALDGTGTTKDYRDLFLKGTSDGSNLGIVTKYSNYPNDTTINSLSMDTNDFTHTHSLSGSFDTGTGTSTLASKSIPHTHDMVATAGNFIKKATGLALIKYEG